MGEKEKILKIIVAQRLKELMDEQSLSQNKLSENLGVNQSTVSVWLSGKKLPSIPSLWLIADYFGVDIDYLVGRKND